MRFKAAISGNLHEYMKEEQDKAKTAVTSGVYEVTQNIKNELRNQVVKAGLGTKLAKTWQAKVYPKSQKSLSAVGVIQSKASKIIRVFDQGAVIRSSKGIFLAVPTENAPKKGSDGKRICPSNFPARFGQLRFVYVRSGLSMLVVDKRKMTKVMFFLVPQVSIKKRLDYKSVVNRFAPKLAQTIIEKWQ